MDDKKKYIRNLEEILFSFKFDIFNINDIHYLNSLYRNEIFKISDYEVQVFFKKKLIPVIKEALPHLKEKNDIDIKILYDLEYNITDNKNCFTEENYSSYIISIHKCLNNTNITLLKKNIEIVINVIYCFLFEDKDDKFENKFWIKGKQYLFFEENFPQKLLQIIIDTFISCLNSKCKENKCEWNENEKKIIDIAYLLLKMKVITKDEKFNDDKYIKKIKCDRNFIEKLDFNIPKNVFEKLHVFYYENVLIMLFIVYLYLHKGKIDNWEKITLNIIKNDISQKIVTKSNDLFEKYYFVQLLIETNTINEKDNIFFIMENILKMIEYIPKSSLEFFKYVYTNIKDNDFFYKYFEEFKMKIYKESRDYHNLMLHTYNYFYLSDSIQINHTIHYILKEIWYEFIKQYPNNLSRPIYALISLIYDNHLLFSFGSLQFNKEKQYLQKNCFLFIIFNLLFYKSKNHISIDRLNFCLPFISEICNDKQQSLHQKWNNIIKCLGANILKYKIKTQTTFTKNQYLFGIIYQKEDKYYSVIYNAQQDVLYEYGEDVFFHKGNMKIESKLENIKQLLVIYLIPVPLNNDKNILNSNK